MSFIIYARDGRRAGAIEALTKWGARRYVKRNYPPGYYVKPAPKGR